jgi:hypothetical protein
MYGWSLRMCESIRQRELRASAACSAIWDVMSSGVSWVIRRYFLNLDILLRRLKLRKPSRLALPRAEDLTFYRESDRFRAFLRVAHRNVLPKAVFLVYLCFFRNFPKSPLGKRYDRSIRNFNPVLHIYRSSKTIEGVITNSEISKFLIKAWRSLGVPPIGYK